MRMLMNVTLPHEPFNAAIRNGSAGGTLKKILADVKPEAVYFSEHNGQRAAVLIVDVADPSKVPALAEPWFLSFSASVEFRIVMSAEDLGRANLDAIGRKWG
jgi:hypothetical protein